MCTSTHILYRYVDVITNVLFKLFQAFWKQITKEMSEIDYHTSEFRTQTEIPLKPIRRVMCQEGDIGINKVMFAAESTILFAKVSVNLSTSAAELSILF